jgi:hypothetical protein
LILAASLLVPGSWPVSTRRCLAQPRSVSATIPTRGPIRFTAAFNDNDGSSFIASATSRNARSRSSSGYFRGAGTDPPSRGFRPSTAPGAVHYPVGALVLAAHSQGSIIATATLMQTAVRISSRSGVE